MSCQYKDKNCIVSGGSGFIGQNLVKKLLDEGAKVFVIDNFSFGAKKSSVDSRAFIIESDIRGKKWIKYLPPLKYDYFFHFGSPSSVVLFNKYPKECRDITINGFLNVLNFCKENKTRLIYPSTGSLYSGLKPPHSENAKLKEEFMNNYAKTKFDLEKIQKEHPEVNSLGLRIFAGYGPGEKHKEEFASVPYLFAKDMVQNKPPLIFGDGNQTRDFVFIEDVIEAILILAEKAKEPIINIGTGKATQFNELINIINEILGKEIKPRYIQKPNLYLESTLADLSILQKYYTPRWGIIECLEKTIQYIKEEEEC